MSVLAKSWYTARHKSPYQAQAVSSSPEQGLSPLSLINTKVRHTPLTLGDNNLT
jgi:hypothetical protein